MKKQNEKIKKKEHTNFRILDLRIIISTKAIVKGKASKFKKRSKLCGEDIWER